MPEFVDHIIVVDDRSTDATLERCREWQGRLGRRLTVMEQPKNQGVGAAITMGYQIAMDLGIDVVAVMAGDGQMDPKDLTLIIDPVINGKADYSKGNRLFTGEAWRKTPHVRYLGNAFLSMLTKIASGYWHIADSQSGFTAISRTALKTLDLGRLYPSYGYPNDLLIQLNIHSFRVADVPVHPRYGIGERSSMNVMKVIPTVSFLLFRLPPAGQVRHPGFPSPGVLLFLCLRFPGGRVGVGHPGVGIEAVHRRYRHRHHRPGGDADDRWPAVSPVRDVV
jgi:glycosyltransferase involved in cell wall biosynthesis